ncbi:hypothetical protein N0V90_011460 [Kalmusia sp. IMI 367209]|nr:hypothetical protein N0V90_011460 [Kalmusia sp. IMI 367209]
MSSPDPDWRDSPDDANVSESPVVAPPVSPRKRRRSSSAGSTSSRKRVSTSRYHDAYRLLFNHLVRTTTGQGNIDESSARISQYGASIWTASEKSAFFSAIDKLGKDNLPGIAKAVGTKSIPEIRQFLLLLHDAFFDQTDKRAKSRFNLSLQDIPAALEIGVACERQLEAAGDTLAMMQERFEATQEQRRYGEHWLITPDLADQIELAVRGSYASLPADNEGDHVRLDGANDAALLQEIPEAQLLIPKTLLELSQNVFMNPSPATVYPWAHWTELVSELATEPSMYRTAFRDFHTLVLSLTKRLMQTALIQATSRIRSQGWRAKKGVLLYVRERDVHTAADLLGLKKTRRQYWRDVPRRCRLNVWQGKWRKRRQFTWDEVERTLDSLETRATPLGSDTDTPGPDSEAEDENFKSRATRSGTPLPQPGQVIGIDSNSDHSDTAMVDPDSDMGQQSEQDSEVSSLHVTEDEESLYDSSEDELQALEGFDQDMSREEERKLWHILRNTSMDGQTPAEPEIKFEEGNRKGSHRKRMEQADDWRTWTHFHAEWEEFRIPVSSTNFLANQMSPSPAHVWAATEDQDTDNGTETGWSSAGRISKRKPLLPTSEELPLRDARTYAAIQGRTPFCEERDVESDASQDDAKSPTLSIE